MKCDTCLNTRVITSENGKHPVCNLSEGDMVKCLLGSKNYYICDVLDTEKEEEKDE